MGTKPTNFHTVNSYDSLDWGYSGGRVTFIWEEAPGGAIEIQVTVDDAGADGRGIYHVNAGEGPYDALTSVLDMFALSEKVRAFGQIELEIRDAVKTISAWLFVRLGRFGAVSCKPI